MINYLLLGSDLKLSRTLRTI